MSNFNGITGLTRRSLLKGSAHPQQAAEVIRWFGSRKKIFNVHFRNIKGGRYSFTEEFPDNGDMDMPAALKLYKEVGYDGMIMPDHVPHIDAGNSMETAFAFWTSARVCMSPPMTIICRNCVSLVCASPPIWPPVYQPFWQNRTSGVEKRANYQASRP